MLIEIFPEFIQISLNQPNKMSIFAVYICTLVQVLYIFSMVGAILKPSWNEISAEVEDTVYDVQDNLYSILNINPTSDQSTIRKSFRQLSLVLHPDKNEHPDAERNFRRLVAAYDILKNKEKRGYYDYILEHGLPTWKQAVYFYNRGVKKLTLLEFASTLLFLFTAGHYLFHLTIYVEAKYKLEHRLCKEARRGNKKGKKKAIEEELNLLQWPSIYKTFPFVCVELLWHAIKSLYALWHEKRAQKHLRILKQQQQQNGLESEKLAFEKRKLRDGEATKFSAPLISCDPPPLERKAAVSILPIVEENPSLLPLDRPWRDEDYSKLIKCVQKHPVGEEGRWVKIAEDMHRTVADVTRMKKLMESSRESAVVIKAKAGQQQCLPEWDGRGLLMQQWTQEEQRALESGLLQFRNREEDIDMWDKIADLVRTKSAAECLQRYKVVVETLKSKRKHMAQQNGK